MAPNHILGVYIAMECLLMLACSQGLNDAAMGSAYGAQASDNLSYLKNPIWWAGMVTSAFFFLFHSCTLTILQCSGLR